jgi:hypothetical protein
MVAASGEMAREGSEATPTEMYATSREITARESRLRNGETVRWRHW